LKESTVAQQPIHGKVLPNQKNIIEKTKKNITDWVNKQQNKMICAMAGRASHAFVIAYAYDYCFSFVSCPVQGKSRLRISKQNA